MSIVTFEEKRTNSCNGNILSEISVNPFNNCGNIYFRKNLVPTRRKFRITKIPLCITGRIMLNRLQKPHLSPKQSCSTETKRNFRFLTIFLTIDQSHSAYMVEISLGKLRQLHRPQNLNICFSSGAIKLEKILLKIWFLLVVKII